MRAALMIAAALAACVDAPANPTLVLTGEAATPEVLEGARAWTPLAFEVAPASDLPVCPADWVAGDACQLAITVIWNEERTLGGLASIELRRIRVGIDNSPDSLRRMGAHEVGHILLRDGAHLAPNQGVMSIGPTGWTLTEADHVFARAHGVVL